MGALKHYCSVIGTGLCLLFASPLAAQVRLTADEKSTFEKEGRIIVDLLQNHHYGRVTFMALENSKILNLFTDTLDSRKRIFTAEDLAYFHTRFDRSLKSVYLLRGDFSPAFEIMERFKKRLDDRITWIDQFLASSPALELDGTFETKKSDETKAIDAKEQDDWWRRALVDQLISEQASAVPPKEAAERVAERFHKWHEAMRKLKATNVREMFADAMIRTFDPHSGYFSADSAEDFSLMMEGGVCSVGLVVEKQGGRCEVMEVLAGGPADLESSLTPGDEILELQEDGQPSLNARTAYLREVMRRLKGKADSQLVVKFKHQGSEEVREIRLTRRYFTLIKFKAHGGIISLDDAAGKHRRVGYLRWPQFYDSKTEEHRSSVADDVQELLKEEMAAGVEGVVIDLRDNPGGSLPEAITLVQHFVGAKVATVTADAAGKTSPMSGKGAALYSGPVVVLTSSKSASASELFSGALKYYRRAVIAGEPSTFGKGSVQFYMDLSSNQRAVEKSSAAWGTLRLTSQIFALPDGHAIQRRGIPSDLVFPVKPLDPSDREVDLEGALDEKNVSVACEAPTDEWLPTKHLEALKASALHRFETDPGWELEKRKSKLEEQELFPASKNLKLTQRVESFARFKEALLALGDEQQKLRETSPVSYQRLRLKAVEVDRLAHEKAVRATLGARLSEGAIRNGHFVFCDIADHFWELDADQVDWLQAASNSAAMAKAASQAASLDFPETRVSEMLTRFARTPSRNFAELVSYFEAAATEFSAPAAWGAKAANAVLFAIIKQQNLCLTEEPVKSTEILEAVRVVNDWTDLGKPSSPTP